MKDFLMKIRYNYQAYITALSGDYCYSEPFSNLFSPNSDPNMAFFKGPLFAIFRFGVQYVTLSLISG